MADHDLKTWPDAFDAVLSGAKRFEYRRDDRGYQVGDSLMLCEWSPTTESYSGRRALFWVTYVLRGPAFGIPEGFAVMSITDHLVARHG